jgi:hypothetical protein
MTTQVYPPTLIELANNADLSTYEALNGIVHTFMAMQKSTLWGRSFNINDDNSRKEAVAFLTDTILEILFLVGSINEKFAIRLIAEEALERIQAETDTVIAQVDIHPDGAVPYA